ncbi:MAG: hypothetical protein KAX19_07950 [Candidatus Brocadiae bacterium]|nr:hypothetical protein [Candidatus Brocadiia bacterium]
MADADVLRRQSELFLPEQLTYMMQLLREAKVRARRDTTGRIAVELALVKMSRRSELVPLEEALGELSGGPVSAGPGNERGGSRSGPAAAGEQGATGALRRMRQKLKTGPGGAPAVRNERKPPEGINEVKYREVVASARDPEAGREAMENETLRKAFTEADRALGLSPVRLERTADQEQGDGSDEEAPAEEETE